MAAADPPKAQPATAEQTKPRQGGGRVARTGRMETTARPGNRMQGARKESLVEMNQPKRWAGKPGWPRLTHAWAAAATTLAADRANTLRNSASERRSMPERITNTTSQPAGNAVASVRKSSRARRLARLRSTAKGSDFLAAITANREGPFASLGRKFKRKGPQSSREPSWRRRLKSAEARIRRSRGRRMGIRSFRGAYDQRYGDWPAPYGRRGSWNGRGNRTCGRG